MNNNNDTIKLYNTASEFESKVIIQEIKPDLTPNNEYIELYTNGEIPNTQGWIVTTYDNDQIILPAITAGGNYTYIRIYSGIGSCELDSSDNQVTIYANATSSIIEINGDEVGLHDADGYLIDFFRFNNGNGDEVKGSWDINDSGPEKPTGEQSLSLMGSFEDRGNGSNWMESQATPGEPNIGIFPIEDVQIPNQQAIQQEPIEDLRITNGIRNQETIVGIDDEWNDPEGAEEVPYIPEGEEEPPPGPLDAGSNVSIKAGKSVKRHHIDAIREHLSFSLQFYRQIGFIGPETGNDTKINVKIVMSKKNYTSGACVRKNGNIIIEIGKKATDEELKQVGEHELMHAFQLKKLTDGSGNPYNKCPKIHKWWIEGQAEYWGIMSMLTNFPYMTMKEWMNMSRDIGSVNWWDHYRNLNGTKLFLGWDKTFDHYMGAFLFNKFIIEEYGDEKMMEIIEQIKYYGPWDKRNVKPRDAVIDVLNKSWEEIYAHFLRWLLLEAPAKNGVPIYTPNVKLDYKGEKTGDVRTVKGSGGAIIEEVEIKNETAFDIILGYSGKNSQYTKWTVQVLIFYEDGTNSSKKVEMDEEMKSGFIRIDPSSPPKKIKKIWVVKGIAEGPNTRINMTIRPAKTIILDYKDETVSDSTNIKENQEVYEIVKINGTKPFLVELDIPEEAKNWRFTINRIWENGTVTSEVMEVNDGLWNDLLIDPTEGEVKLQKIVIIKENLNDKNYTVNMTVTPQVKVSYNNTKTGDITTIEPGKGIHEIIEVEGDEPFAILLSIYPDNLWAVSVKRYWDNGTVDETFVPIIDSKNFNYFVNPKAGNANITKIVIVKYNLGMTNLTVSMKVIPTSSFLTEPELNTTEFNEPVHYQYGVQKSTDYGFIIGAYAYLDTSNNEYILNVLKPEPSGTFDVVILNSDFEIQETYEDQIDPLNQFLEEALFPPDIYLFAILLHDCPPCDIEIIIEEHPL
jgi:hypothetical protein